MKQYVIAGIILVTIITILGMPLFAVKADLYRDFVTQEEYDRDNAEIKSMLNEMRGDIKFLIRENREDTE